MLKEAYLPETEVEKNVSWESPTQKYLEENGIPKKYSTKSPICLIGNVWSVGNADMSAIQTRALPVCFCPKKETIHDEVIKDGWADPLVIEFVEQHLADIPLLTMRDYYNGGIYKKAGFDWENKLRKIWGI